MPVATFDITVGTNDGFAGKTGPSYPPAAADDVNATQTAFYVSRGDNAGTFEVYCGLIRFDTSSLPDDAVVSAASLKLVPITGLIVGSDSRSLVAEYYDFGAAIDATDHTVTAASDAHTGTTIASLTGNVVNTFALQNLGSISLTGLRGSGCMCRARLRSPAVTWSGSRRWSI